MNSRKPSHDSLRLFRLFRTGSVPGGSVCFPYEMEHFSAYKFSVYSLRIEKLGVVFIASAPRPAFSSNHTPQSVGRKLTTLRERTVRIRKVESSILFVSTRKKALDMSQVLFSFYGASPVLVQDQHRIQTAMIKRFAGIFPLTMIMQVLTQWCN